MVCPWTVTATLDRISTVKQVWRRRRRPLCIGWTCSGTTCEALYTEWCRIRLAGDGFGLFPDPLQGRHQDRHEDGNDGDDDQKLGRGESCLD